MKLRADEKVKVEWTDETVRWTDETVRWTGIVGPVLQELEAQDPERTREVYRECLKLVPHKSFSFSKIWVMAANFEIRAKRLDAARKILGLAIGLAPKDKIFKARHRTRLGELTLLYSPSFQQLYSTTYEGIRGMCIRVYQRDHSQKSPTV